MKQNSNVYYDGAELNNEDPNVVEGKSIPLIIRTGPAPGSSFDVVMVTVPIFVSTYSILG